MSNYKKIFLKKGKDESLLRFHPWVFSGAIASMDDGIEEGSYRDWETDRKSTRLNSSHRSLSRMPSSA